MRIITGSCPNCHQENQIELDEAPSAEHGVVVTCDHCGVTKRLARFQKEYRRQIAEKEKERQSQERQSQEKKRHEAERRESDAERERALRETEALMALSIQREAASQPQHAIATANGSRTCDHCGNPCAPDAPMCPKCGHPFASVIHAPQAAAGPGAPPVIVHPAKEVQTIEKTGKKWKAWMLVGAATSILSVPVCIVGGAEDLSELSGFGGLGIATGLVIFIGARIGAWWYHG